MDRGYYDVTVSLSDTLPVFPGDPSVKIEHRSLALDRGTFRVSSINFGSHTGTHVDPPYHFFKKGVKVDRLPLETLCGKARVFELIRKRGISADDLARLQWRGVRRVLFKTRRTPVWARDGLSGASTYLTAQAARFLVTKKVSLVGIDQLSIDSLQSRVHEAHRALLGSGIVVLEGLDLTKVPQGDYDLFALPLKLRDGDGAPARVILKKRPIDNRAGRHTLPRLSS